MEVHKTCQDIGDPEDWPQEWMGIREMDASLRCSICCEYMDTPMILSKCSHSYCSLCIRRSIYYKTQCPTCFVAATEGDMVNNRSLGEIIQKFSIIRKRLLAVLCRNNNHIEETICVPPTDSTNSKPDRGMLSSLFAKSKSPLTKKPTGDCGKVATVEKKSKQYGLRTGHEKNYIQSDDSDTVNSDSDSDVVICGDAEHESSDEDFQPMTPSTNRKKKNTMKVVHSTSKKPSSHPTGNLDTSRSSNNKPKGVAVTAMAKSVEPDEANLMLETADKLELSYQSPLRLPSLNPNSSLQSSTPLHSQVPSCSSAVQGGSAEKAGRSVVRVPCPVCGVEVSDKHINLHLDRCLTNKGRTAESRPTPTRRKQMPKLVYNLLSDKDLKKKCAEVGLNNQGDRQTLTKRHHEFTLMYNSQCDATKPMTAGEIIREVEKTERAKSKGLQMKIASVNKLVIQKGSSADQVEAAQKEYAKQHKSQFSQLIEEARKRRMKKQAEKTAAAGAPEENTGATDTPMTMLPTAAMKSESSVIDAQVAEPTASTPLKETVHPTPVPPSQPNYPILSTSVPPILPPTHALASASSSKRDPGTACDSGTVKVPAVSAVGQWDDDLETQFLEDDSSDMLLAQQPEVMPDIRESVATPSTAAGSRVVESHSEVDRAAHDGPPDDAAEETCGDETLPLEDSQLNVSDDDMFDSPGSPSLLVDAHQSYTQNSFLTFHGQGDDHTDENFVTANVPSEFDFAPHERTLVGAPIVPVLDGEASIANQGSEEIESEDRDFVETTKTDKRKRGRPKKDTKAKVKASRTQNEGADIPSTTAPVSDEAEVQPGWADVHGHDDAVQREDAASETLSEPASGVSSLSHTDGSIGDFNVPSWSRDVDITMDAEIAQPRRSSRARNKRKLSGDSSEPVAVGKRSRRPELPKDTDGHAEMPATEELENKGQGERRRQGRRK